MSETTSRLELLLPDADKDVEENEALEEREPAADVPCELGRLWVLPREPRLDDVRLCLEEEPGPRELVTTTDEPDEEP